MPTAPDPAPCAEGEDLYECPACQNRLCSGERVTTCPKCGEDMENLSKSRLE